MNTENYDKIYDSSSYMILRTNPRLTTNIKLVYNAENDSVFLRSYQANPTLSKTMYSYYGVNAETSYYNEDLYEFYTQNKSLLPNTIAYQLKQVSANSQFTSRAYNQFERFYAMKSSLVNKSVYGAGISVEAPIYLKKQLPEYIVIFKIPGACNTNYNYENSEDSESSETGIYTMSNKEIVRQMQIVKTINITDNTKFGRYIRRYVNQKEFYDSPLLVNQPYIYIRGIDYLSGSMSSRKVDISTIIRNDLCLNVENGRLSELFYSNNMVLANILNIEIMFDDENADDFEVNRYFAMYCNNIEFEKLSIRKNNFVSTDPIYNTGFKIVNFKCDESLNSDKLSSSYIVNSKDDNAKRVTILAD